MTSHHQQLPQQSKICAPDFFLAAAAHPETRIARTGRLSGRRLQRAIGYMLAHLTEDIRLGDVAAAAGLSAFHFARMFRKTTGLTPHRYLMETRVERAKELLLRCEKSLAQVAAESGFSDQSHMNRVFRSFTGMTPVNFRNAGMDRWRLEIPLCRPSLRPGCGAAIRGESELQAHAT